MSLARLGAVLIASAACACAAEKRDGSGSSAGSYVLCDGSDDVRLALVSEGGQLDTTFEFTNPYGHSFLFVDGRCHYYASKSWLEGVVQGDLSRTNAQQIEEELSLAKVDRLDYHDAESCPDASVNWLRTASGYIDCTCGCDDKAPREVERALDQAGTLADELITQGAALDGPIALLALDEGKPSGSNANLPAWPLIWPLSDIAIEWEAYTRGLRPSARVLTGSEASTARMLRADARRQNTSAGAVRVMDLGKVYNLFMHEELPDEAQSAIARFEAQ